MSDGDGEWVTVAAPSKKTKPKDNSSSKNLKKPSTTKVVNTHMIDHSSQRPFSNKNHNTGLKANSSDIEKQADRSHDVRGGLVLNSTVNPVLANTAFSSGTPKLNAWATTDINIRKLSNSTEKTTVLCAPLSADENFAAQCRIFSSDIKNNLTKQQCVSVSKMGFINSGNSCFRNCILQCLLSLPVFQDLVLRLSASLQGKLYDLSDNLIYWRELLAFSASLWGEQSVFRTTHILPDTYFRNLFDAFDNYANRSLIERYSGSTQSKRPQHDSMEFLTFVLDKLHEQVQSFKLDVNPSSPLTSMAGGEDDGWSTVGKGGSKVVVDEQSKNIANSMATASIVTKIFQGLLRCEVDYRHKKLRSTTFQTFHCLTLNFAKEFRHNQSLSEALDEFFTVECIESRTKIWKQVKLEHLPRVLIMHVGRFSFDFSTNTTTKINREMKYPPQLVIQNHCLSDNVSHESGETYQLQSLVLHHGKNATEGHYTTYFKDDMGSWWHANDTIITPISDDDALDAADKVYLLFYQKVLMKTSMKGQMT